MLTSTFLERTARLIEVGLTNRRRQLPLVLAGIDAKAAAAGSYHSGNRLLLIQQAISQELAIRAVIIWRAIVRVHGLLGAAFTPTLRQDLAALFDENLLTSRRELSALLEEKTRSTMLREPLTLNDAFSDADQKHHLEIDLYVDTLSRAHGAAAMTQTYNFYGSVGAVQTGPEAVANVVQNLTSSEKNELIEAIQEIKVAIGNAGAVVPNRGELVEIADECAAIIESANPNNSKLRAMFDILSSSVQAIANAQPAYQALKLALLPLGIMLP